MSVELLEPLSNLINPMPINPMPLGLVLSLRLGAGLPALGMGWVFFRNLVSRGLQGSKCIMRGSGWLVLLILVLLSGGGTMVWKWLNQGNTNVTSVKFGKSGKVLILGVDGMDPKLLDSYMAKGVMPNFVRLRDQGVYSRLGTTTPPESPVAWSTFATGCNPGKHGLFDFVRRAPNTYFPDLALVQVKGNQYEAQRKGVPFWSLTSDQNVPTTVIRCPITFPPEEVRGRMLSGMGVPDLRGSQGTFFYWTTDPLTQKKATGGKVIPVSQKDKRIETEIFGPPDGSGEAQKDLSLPLVMTLQPEHNSATFTLQDQSYTVKEKEWSPWFRVTFKRSFFSSVSAICRFYLKSVGPEVAVYGSPLNFDPEKPPYPISYPKGYAKELVKEIGLYHTQGMPEDTWALNEERIDEQTFLEQSQHIHQEREAMLWYELKRWQDGPLVLVFDTVDRIQHMFWRYIDPQHPLYDPTEAEQYGGVIEDWYRKIDTLLGRVLDTIDTDTLLIVLSDHGFSSFRRAVHLNSWLKQHGFLRLKAGKTTGREFGLDIDWEHSQAYALGIGGIYLNLQGREPSGIVRPEEAEALKTRLSEQLLTLKDPKTDASVVRRVLPRETVYTGPETQHAPDLFVGFEEGYRASWQTALIGVPAELIEDNTKKWSGDHIVDPELVPGILLVNRKLDLNSSALPTLKDIAPTILRLTGVEIPANFDGTALWHAEPPQAQTTHTTTVEEK